MEDELEWGYGPLAAAAQSQAHAGSASPSAERAATARDATAGDAAFDKLARAAAVRADNAAGGRGKRQPRRKKDKKAGFKASDLMKAAPDEEPAASPGGERALSPTGGGSDGDEQASRGTAGRAARQPFGAVATTLRRRAGGRTADDALSPKDGSATATATLTAAEPPANGFAALTTPQLVVVREVFDHVDVGSKGWLCRDDVQQIVHTLNKPAAASKPRAVGNGGALSKSEALERTRILPDEQEQRKQDSFRGATSPTPEDDEDDEQLWGMARSAGRLTAQDMDRQVAEAEKERRREALRQKKRAEREAAATVELLKVLVRITPEERALRQLHGTAAEPPIRLSFGDFSAAVDHAMLTTSTVGNGAKGARPGELYCRKMVTHWRWARGSAPVQGQFFTDQPLGMALGGGGMGGGYDEMLELLVPLSMRSGDLEEEEIL